MGCCRYDRSDRVSVLRFIGHSCLSGPIPASNHRLHLRRDLRTLVPSLRKRYFNADWNVVLKYPPTSFLCGKNFDSRSKNKDCLWVCFGMGALPLIVLGGIWRWWTLRSEKSSAEAQLLAFLTRPAHCRSSLTTHSSKSSVTRRDRGIISASLRRGGAIDLIGGILARTQWIKSGEIDFCRCCLVFSAFHALEKCARTPDRYRPHRPQARRRSDPK